MSRICEGQVQRQGKVSRAGSGAILKGAGMDAGTRRNCELSQEKVAGSSAPVACPRASDRVSSRLADSGSSSVSRLRRHAHIYAGLFGILIALTLVLVWFSRIGDIWSSPIQEIDAPSHYYFIRKLLRNGLSVALTLNPNDSFYPPLFHLLVYGLMRLCALFGINITIFAGVNLIWIAYAGLVFPIGMLLWTSYFLDGLCTWQHCLLSAAVPILSVVSAAFPYWTLSAGPLLAYGLGTALLPFALYAGLRLMDAVTAECADGSRHIWKWAIVNILFGLLIMLAHPRVAFTYLVLIGFFVLFRLPWRWILAALGGLGVAVLLFALYVMRRDHGKDFLHPSNWFHTYQPTRSLSEAFRIVITDFLPGVAGVIMAVCLLLSVLASLLLSGRRRADGLALVLSYLLVGIIFFCSASVKGSLANVLTAVWYRGETRPMTMIPLAVVPLLAFGMRCLLRYRKDTVRCSESSLVSLCCAYGSSILVVVLLSGLISTACLFNPVKETVASNVARNTGFIGTDQFRQLTDMKREVLSKVNRQVGPHATVIADPLNGSMYGMTLYGMDMLYPVYNPMDTKNGKVFGQVEHAFASGDPELVLRTTCPVITSYRRAGDVNMLPTAKYLLTMGDQAPDLQMFTYRAQYYPFHDQGLIDGYIKSKALQKVADFGSPADDGQRWALYRFSCH